MTAEHPEPLSSAELAEIRSQTGDDWFQREQWIDGLLATVDSRDAEIAALRDRYGILERAAEQLTPRAEAAEAALAEAVGLLTKMTAAPYWGSADAILRECTAFLAALSGPAETPE